MVLLLNVNAFFTVAMVPICIPKDRKGVKSANHRCHPLQPAYRITDVLFVRLLNGQLNRPEVFVVESLSLAPDYVATEERVDRKIKERFNAVPVSFGTQGIVLALSIMQ